MSATYEPMYIYEHSDTRIHSWTSADHVTPVRQQNIYNAKLGLRLHARQCLKQEQVETSLRKEQCIDHNFHSVILFYHNDVLIQSYLLTRFGSLST